MGLGQPQPVFDSPDMTRRRITLSTSAPTTGSDISIKQAISEATGRVHNSGKVSVASEAAVTLTCYCFCLTGTYGADNEAIGRWMLAGAASSSSAKAFDDESVDTFKAPPGALYKIKSSGAGSALVSGPTPTGPEP